MLLNRISRPTSTVTLNFAHIDAVISAGHAALVDPDLAEDFPFVVEFHEDFDHLIAAHLVLCDKQRNPAVGAPFNRHALTGQMGSKRVLDHTTILILSTKEPPVGQIRGKILKGITTDKKPNKSIKKNKPKQINQSYGTGGAALDLCSDS